MKLRNIGCILAVLLVHIIVSRTWDLAQIVGHDPLSFPDASYRRSYSLTSLFSDWSTTTTTQYSFSLWTKRGAYQSGDWCLTARLGNSAQNLDDGRIAVILMNTNDTTDFPIISATNGANATDSYGDDYNNTFVSLNSAFWLILISFFVKNSTDFYQENVWTFFFFSSNTDPASYSRYGYVLNTNSGITTVGENNFTSGGQPYALNSSTYFMIGGDDPAWNHPCNCSLSEVRFYRGISVTDSSLMSRFSDYGIDQIYLFNFKNQTDETQTFSVTIISYNDVIPDTPITQSGSSQFGFNTQVWTDTYNPQFGAYYLICTGNSIAFYDFDSSTLCSSMSFKFSFRPKSAATAPPNTALNSVQTIFSIFSGDSAWAFTVEYLYQSSSLQVRQNSSPSHTTSSNTILADAWNQVVINFYWNARYDTQSTFRLYLNGQTSPAIDSSSLQIPAVSSPIISFCGKGQPNGFVLTDSAVIDISDFTAICGVGSLYYESTDTSECLNWFDYGSILATCAMCKSNTYFFGQTCVSSCSAPYFNVAGSQSCETCNPPFVQTSTDVCSNASVPYFTINTNTTLLNVSESAAISVAVDSSLNIGSPYTIAWSVTTNTSNQTANELLTNFLNSQSSAMTVITSSNMLLQNQSDCNYTLTAVICNTYDFKSVPKSVNITVLALKNGDNSFNFNGQTVNLDPNTVQKIKSSATAASSLASTATGGLIIGQILSGGAGNIFAALLNTLGFIVVLQFCDVGYPPNAQQFFLFVTHNASLIPNPIKSNSVNSTKYLSQRGLFETFGLTVNFLSNAGGPLALIAGSLLAILVFKLLISVLSGKINCIASLLTRIVSLLQWGFVISMTIGAQVTFALSLLLQFTSPVFDAYGSVNFVAGIVVFLLQVAFYYWIYRFIRWHCRVQSHFNYLENKSSRLFAEKLKVLWFDFDMKKFFGRNYIFLSLFRNVVAVIVIYSFTYIPILQCCLLIMLSIGYLALVSAVNPFTQKSDFLSTILIELLILVQEIIMLAFAANKSTIFISLDAAMVGGQGLIGIIITILLIHVVFAIVSFIKFVLREWANYKASKAAQSDPKQIAPRISVINFTRDLPAEESKKDSFDTSRTTDHEVSVHRNQREEATQQALRAQSNVDMIIPKIIEISPRPAKNYIF